MAACGGVVQGASGDSGANAADGRAGDDRLLLDSSDGAATDAEDAGSDRTVHGNTDAGRREGGREHADGGGGGGGDGGSSTRPGAPVDAGKYFGDGSFWVDGGAYHGSPDGSVHGGMDATVLDAAPGCGALAACCASLTGATQTLCNSIVGSGNASNCATELTDLQSLGDCTGVTTLASGIEEPASRLVSDGALLFGRTTWTLLGCSPSRSEAERSRSF
jgi:hypothetical protein